MTQQAVILAGGLATRLKPITEKIPKSLVEVAGRPFIDWQLRLLAAIGIQKVVLCLGYLGEQVEAVVGDGADWQLEVKYSYDGPIQLGTGGALRQAEPLLDEVFWVLYGDSYLKFDYTAAVAYFADNGQGKAGLMTVFANQNKWDTSNVIFREGQLITYDKWRQVPEMEYIDYGATLLRRSSLGKIPGGEPYDLATFYYQLVEDKLLLGYEVTQRFYEIGSFKGLAETEEFFQRGEV